MKAKVSVIQFQPAMADPEENISRLRPLFENTQGSQVVVLPELSNAGYNFHGYDEAREYSEVIGEKGLFQDYLLSEAKARNIFIVSGINERDGDRLFNTSLLVSSKGIMGKYRKAHLFMNEKDIFQKGDTGFPVFDLGGFKIGMMICFDYLFPEPWRLMAQRGADLICHPSNLLTMNAHRCLPGLSLMNRIYIATANRYGTERGITFSGLSVLSDPMGNTIAMASSDKSEIISFGIDTDLSRNKMITNRNHVFNDRRPEIYAG
jgi:predicted amidohydrolase